MAGRKSKYTPETVDKIKSTLAAGATIKDTCAYAGITEKTFFEWMSSPSKSEFRELVSYAQGQARVAATLAIKSAIKGVEQVANTNDTYTETRVNKVTGELYEFRKTKQSRTVTQLAPDWRAAIEYLKRRDPEHWSDRVDININVELVTKTVKALEEAGIDPAQVFNDIIAETALLKQDAGAAGDREAGDAD
jgi:hypothetical protein